MSSYIEDDDSSHSTNDGESTGLKMSLRERPRQIQTRQRLRKQAEELKFMQDFDPEKSTRERRKLSRKPFVPAPPVSKYTAYDERGKLRDYSINICDCMDEKCPGCFFPCPICDSSKCGPVCRMNRKFTYESIEFDGKDGVIKNKFAGKY